ncbi:MAG: hypothetical protein Q9181_005774 [Wetmoreana brouardii]
MATTMSSPHSMHGDQIRGRSIILKSNGTGELVANDLNFTVGDKMSTANTSNVSGATMKPPQILKKFGIGERQLLESFGVMTLCDTSDVGEILQAHPQCLGPIVPKEAELKFNNMYDNDHNASSSRVNEQDPTELLACTVNQAAQLSWNQILGPEKQDRPSEIVTKYYNDSKGQPDLKTQLDSTTKNLLDPNKQAVQTSGNTGNGAPPKPRLANKAAVIGFLAHPFSRGYVPIKSHHWVTLFVVPLGGELTEIRLMLTHSTVTTGNCLGY